MTIRETERLTKVETKQDDMAEDITEMKGDIKEIKQLLYDQKGKYISKKAAAWLAGFVATVAMVTTAIITAIRTH
jgi:hypothetical protein